MQRKRLTLMKAGTDTVSHPNRRIRFLRRPPVRILPGHPVPDTAIDSRPFLHRRMDGTGTGGNRRRPGGLALGDQRGDAFGQDGKRRCEAFDACALIPMGISSCGSRQARTIASITIRGSSIDAMRGACPV